MDEDILAVAEAAARLQSPGVEQHSAADRLHCAVAVALTHGRPVRQVAAVAHMTALEVVDAAEAATYQAFPGPQRKPEAHDPAPR